MQISSTVRLHSGSLGILEKAIHRGSRLLALPLRISDGRQCNGTRIDTHGNLHSSLHKHLIEHVFG